MRTALPAFLALALAAAPALHAAGAAANPQLAEGRRLFAETCAQCHGEDGRAGAGYQTPIWGREAKIARFETAMGLFEYNQMLMPFDDPSRLTDEQKWAIVAYLLANHGTIAADVELGPANAATIPIR
jgi:cytochrome c